MQREAAIGYLLDRWIRDVLRLRTPKPTTLADVVVEGEVAARVAALRAAILDAWGEASAALLRAPRPDPPHRDLDAGTGAVHPDDLFAEAKRARGSPLRRLQHLHEFVQRYADRELAGDASPDIDAAILSAEARIGASTTPFSDLHDGEVSSMISSGVFTTTPARRFPLRLAE